MLKIKESNLFRGGLAENRQRGDCSIGPVQPRARLPVAVGPPSSWIAAVAEAALGAVPATKELLTCIAHADLTGYPLEDSYGGALSFWLWRPLGAPH